MNIKKKEVNPLLCMSSILLMLTSISALTLTPTPASADDDTVVDEIQITVPTSCTLNGVVDTPHAANIVPGNYNDGTNHAGIGKTTLKAYCNDTNGFAIYAVGYTNDEIGNTDLEGTNTSSVIETGTATGGSSSDPSNWSMKLSAISGTYTPTIETTFQTFTSVPSDYARVAYRTSGTTIDTSVTGSQLTTAYAAYVNSTQVADTYVGQVLYALVHPYDADPPTSPQPAAPGKIVYHPNGGNVVGTMGQQTAGNSASVVLLASNFSRQGYGFAGWSTTHDYSDPTGFYGPQEQITTPSDTTTNGLSLYARWIKSAGNLQGWTGCSSLASGAVTALTDQRDNDTYAVAKLADGNCWMIENLRLDNTNSDNSTGALSQGYATGFIGLANPESPWANDSTTANSLYSTDGSTSVTISGSSPAYRMPRYNNVNTPSSASYRPSNPTSNSATNNASNAGMYSYGNYYTWTATSTDTSTTSAGDYNTKSICPTGWSIPRGGNKSREATNDFWTYIVTNLNGGTNPANYDSNTTPSYTGTAEAGPVANALRNYPNNFVYSGFISSSSVNSRGSNGYYWSSTAGGSNFAYNLYLNSSYVYPGTNSGGSKSNGRSVRCIIPGT